MSELGKTQMIKEYILEQVASGKIENGQRLPSCRTVAGRLRVNKITVNKAYGQMEDEHLVFSIPRGGFYLIDCGQKRPKPSIIDFSVIKPDEKLIPYREFAHVINQAIDLKKSKVFGCERTEGLPSFRETLKTLFEKDGVYSSKDNIIVTNGAQQAIYLSLRTLFSGKNGKLLVEVPTYGLAVKMAQSLGIQLVGIERTVDGYDFRRMEQILKSNTVLAFYVIPRHQHPTGYSLAEKCKRKISELCNQYNVQILEDDYLADLGSKPGAMPIHYYDTHDRTFYIRSFSKTFMPGIRIGALVLPKQSVEKATACKRLEDLSTSMLPQAALDLFIRAGMYEKHIKQVKKAYESKMEKARDIFTSLCPQNITWHIPHCGIFIWLKFPKPIDTAGLKKGLEDKGIIIRTAEEYFISGNNRSSCLSLCIANVPPEDIGALAAVISETKSYL
jgi:DNA-binding transcriptional MocR family regulator